MTPESAARMVGRIFDVQDMVRAIEQQIAPKSGVPQALPIVDPQAFTDLDEKGERIPKPDTVPNPEYPRVAPPDPVLTDLPPAVTTVDPKVAPTDPPYYADGPGLLPSTPAPLQLSYVDPETGEVKPMNLPSPKPEPGVVQTPGGTVGVDNFDGSTWELKPVNPDSPNANTTRHLVYNGADGEQRTFTASYDENGKLIGIFDPQTSAYVNFGYDDGELIITGTGQLDPGQASATTEEVENFFSLVLPPVKGVRPAVQGGKGLYNLLKDDPPPVATPPKVPAVPRKPELDPPPVNPPTIRPPYPDGPDFPGIPDLPEILNPGGAGGDEADDPPPEHTTPTDPWSPRVPDPVDPGDPGGQDDPFEIPEPSPPDPPDEEGEPTGPRSPTAEAESAEPQSDQSETSAEPQTGQPPAASEPDRESSHGLDSMPTMRELLNTPEGELLEILQRGLDGEYGGTSEDGAPPLRLQIDHVEAGRHPHTGLPYIEIGGSVRDGEGNEVGRVQRIFQEDSDGDLMVEHAWFSLNKDVRGRGFSSGLFRALKEYYVRSGVTGITLHASLEDGGWAWARAGFHWNNMMPGLEEENRRSMLSQIQEVMSDPSISDADRIRLAELANLFNGPSERWPSPQDMSELAGESNPRLGERILRGSSWYGVMWL
ncbi:hypothetical protein [Nocardia sp. NPDC050710]|uniref:hypothetical protein n=1 Tax=Nocardia sp. NPDC050710 TaxID=3157220 RepID=UPI0033C2B57B